MKIIVPYNTALLQGRVKTCIIKTNLGGIDFVIEG